MVALGLSEEELMEISREEAIVILGCAWVAYEEGIGPDEGFYELLARIFKEYPDIVATELSGGGFNILKEETIAEGKL